MDYLPILSYKIVMNNVEDFESATIEDTAKGNKQPIILSAIIPSEADPNSAAQQRVEREKMIEEYLDLSGISIHGGLGSKIGHDTMVGERVKDKKRNIESTLYYKMKELSRSLGRPELDLYYSENKGVHEMVISQPLVKKQRIDTGEVKLVSHQRQVGKTFLGKPKYETSETKEPVFEEVNAPVIHSELVGGGTEEAATAITFRLVGGSEYIDNSGRGGQQLVVELILPESKAIVLLQEIKNNPALSREFVYKAVTERSSIGKDGWNGEAVINRGHSVEPPYDSWKNESGKNVLRFLDLHKEGHADLGFEDIEY